MTALQVHPDGAPETNEEMIEAVRPGKSMEANHGSRVFGWGSLWIKPRLVGLCKG